MEAVIIGRNESDYILDMLKSLERFGIEKDKLHYVFDRCTDESVEIAQALELDYKELTNYDYEYRLTCTARNLGLSMCSPTSDVLFIDGDRYMKKGDVEWIYEELRDYDILLLTCYRDDRTVEEVEENKGTVYNRFYSCGIIMKRNAINKIIDFLGELWNRELEPEWGVEDTYMGDVVYHLGLKYTLIPRSTITLNGELNKKEVNSNIFFKRFQLRDKLNVRW